MLSRPVFTRQEVIALFLAASTAPVVTCLVFGSFRLGPVTAAIAFLAAAIVGAPLFACLRHWGWSLASRSLAAATVAGLVAAVCIVALVLLGFPPHDFVGDPLPTLSIVGLCLAFGLGLGVVAGLTLWLILRFDGVRPSGGEHSGPHS